MQKVVGEEGEREEKNVPRVAIPDSLTDRGENREHGVKKHHSPKHGSNQAGKWGQEDAPDDAKTENGCNRMTCRE